VRALAATGATILGAVVALMPTPSGAAAPALDAPSARSAPTVTVSVPQDKVEGDRFAVMVKVGAASRAVRLELQKQSVDIFGSTEWTPIKSVKVAGKSSHRLASVADELNADRFRAVVRYIDGSHVASRPAAVRVWHWYDLGEFDSYYSTGGVMNYSFLQFAMNGDAYRGWYTTGELDSWEARYTPGRNCKAFRGVFGVTDDSSDGSSADFTLITDEADTVYQSPALVPGQTETVEVKLPMPYRLSIQAHDTSTDGAFSYPAIGTAQFLCTGY
jgi:hypothetical protein